MEQKPKLRAMLLLVIVVIIAALAGLMFLASSSSDDAEDNNNKATDAPPTSTPIYTVISRPVIQAGDEVPVPGDEVVLTVTGNISTSNASTAEVNTVQFNLIRLEALGVVEYQTFDEFGSGTDTVFQGVLLSSVLDVVGIGEGASEIDVIARDGFTVTVPLSDAYDYPSILATKADGVYLTPSGQGPLRLVYPYGYYDLDPGEYDVRWVWNVEQIVVR